MKKRIYSFLLIFVLLCSACTEFVLPQPATSATTAQTVVSMADIPAYSGSPYVVLENNVPDFSDSELTTESFESYSQLDSLGRCGVAYACVGQDLMPTEERGSISSVYPSGWEQATYDFVDGKQLYNRCHLIAFMLAGENANKQNLITGTRYLNIQGMLPFENMVNDYVKETNHHVMYRVTPIFEGDELVARGVEMEALSVEDDEIQFHIYCYNVQPGVEIDYRTGQSHAVEAESTGEEVTYVLNTNSKKFHLPTCSGVSSMNESNRQDYTGTRENLIVQGYDPCGICKP